MMDGIVIELPRWPLSAGIYLSESTVIRLLKISSLTIIPQVSLFALIPIVTNNQIPDGSYVSNLKLYGTVNKTVTLTATLKTPVLSVSLPDFIMPETERNKTSSKTFTIKNNGDYPLGGISLSNSNIDATKYQLSVTGLSDSLRLGKSQQSL
jgi:hypothetical protein